MAPGLHAFSRTLGLEIFSKALPLAPIQKHIEIIK